MKLIFKLTPTAIAYVLNTLVGESDTINQMYYWPKDGSRTCRENGEKLLEVFYNSNGDLDYLLKGKYEGQYVQDEIGYIRRSVKLDELAAFGWETCGGTTLHVDVKTGVMEITGGRTSIRDRFSVLLCVGFGVEAGDNFRNWPKAAPDANGFQAVDWTKFDRSFKPGFKLTQYVTTEPGWDWWHTAHDAVKAATGRWPSELTDKTPAWLLASGLSSQQVAMIQRLAAR